jgi:hypothetical protein
MCRPLQNEPVIVRPAELGDAADIARVGGAALAEVRYRRLSSGSTTMVG